MTPRSQGAPLLALLMLLLGSSEGQGPGPGPEPGPGPGPDTAPLDDEATASPGAEWRARGWPEASTILLPALASSLLPAAQPGDAASLDLVLTELRLSLTGAEPAEAAAALLAASPSPGPGPPPPIGAVRVSGPLPLSASARFALADVDEDAPLATGRLLFKMGHLWAAGLVAPPSGPPSSIFLNYTCDSLKVLVVPDETNDTTKRSFEVGPEICSEFAAALQNDLDEKTRKLLEARDSIQTPEQSESPAHGELVIVFNKLVDEAISYADSYLLSHGLDRAPLPEVSVSLRKGFFLGKDGWVKQLSTLGRTSDFVADITPHLELRGELSLAKLDFGFEHYQAKYSIFKIKGRARGSVRRNAVRVAIKFHVRLATCTMELSDLRVTRLDGIRLRLTGMGPLNGALSRHATRVLKQSKQLVVAMVEKQARARITEYLATVDCAGVVSRITAALGANEV